MKQTILKSIMIPAVVAVCMMSSPLDAHAAATRLSSLRVYFIDVEGGQSTLFVAPNGQSLLIDTGWSGNNGRDADRIVAVAKQAGLSRIDYVLLTHYHEDHVGGVPQLAARFPIGGFLDHGPNRELKNPSTVKGYQAYQAVLAAGNYKHLTMAPGDKLPLEGINGTVISADGNLIAQPLAGAGEENPYCGVSESRPEDQTENARSLGVLITFGKLKILDLGDLTWDKEMQLMCPVNRIGHVDVLIVSHHGWYQSSSPALVDALHARVAIMDNGEKKGGSTPTFNTLAAAPGLQGLWQLHFSDEAEKLNTPQTYIANPNGPDGGNWIELDGDASGNITVTNSRNGYTHEYKR